MIYSQLVPRSARPQGLHKPGNNPKPNPNPIHSPNTNPSHNLKPNELTWRQVDHHPSLIVISKFLIGNRPNCIQCVVAFGS